MTDSLQQQAQDWWLALAAGREDAALQARFDAWLAADDQHRLAYLDVLLAGNAMDASLADQPEPQAELDDLSVAGAAQPRSTRWITAKPWLAGVALSSALVLGLLALPLLQPAWESRGADWRTAAGLTESRTLDDGSRVQLDPGSALRIQMTAQGRQIELLRGALEVEVGADPRPFLIRHQGVEIRDIGTRFRVDESGDSLRISVLEGEVAALAPGQSQAQSVRAGEQIELAGAEWIRMPGSGASPEVGVLVLDQSNASQALAQYERLSGQSVQWLGTPPATRISAALPMRDATEQAAALAQLLHSFDLEVRTQVMGTVWIAARQPAH